MNYTAFQTTLQGLVKAATGFDNGHVIWQEQTRDRPSRPFVGLSIVTDQTNAFTEDSSEDNPDSDGNDGEEILLISREHVELTVQVIVYTSDIVGSSSASEIARKIRRYFGRESVTSALTPHALVDRGTVRNATIVLETEHEGRGVLDLTFRVADQDAEATTYIETATVETTVEQTSGEVVYTQEIAVE